MHKIALSLLVLVMGTEGSALAAGDANVGRTKASACTACHGLTGVSENEDWPNLAGQRALYLSKQLDAFRMGTRKNPLMTAMAKSLSDEDVQDLAAYFSVQNPAPAVMPKPTVNVAALPHAPIMPSDVIKVRPHATRQYWADKLPAGEGHDMVVQRCQFCHDLQRTIAFVRPRSQWEEVVAGMKRRGAPILPEDVTVIVNYLTRQFGPDSPPVPERGGVHEVGMRPCKPSEWPKGSSDFRRKWKAPYNIWVSNQQGASIDVVDPQTRNIVSRITCVSAPDRIEFSGDGNTAYAPDRVEHNITVIDTRTGAIKAKVPLIDRPNTAVLTRDYRKLYAGIWPVAPDEDKRGYVQVLDTQTLKVTKTIQLKGGIHDTWMSPDGKLLLAMSPEGRFMDLLDTRDEHLLWACCTEEEIGTMNMTGAPDASTSRIFFGYSGYPGVVVIDAKTGKELKRVLHPVDTQGPYKGIAHQSGNGKALGYHGGEISPDGKDYWVMQGSFVYRYALPSLKPLGDVHLALIDQAGQPFTPAVEGSWLTMSPDGKKVWAVRPGRNLLSEIDVASMKEEALIPTGEYPLHISIWPRGTP
ncbi:MAG TPA: c-type cytochrome [Steroidobacteraceae bacterium]|jgi:cytochrome c553/DNA-binding beta-propeller fold protein YncE